MIAVQKIRSRYFEELERDIRYRVRRRLKPTVVDVGGVKIGTDSPLLTDKIKRTLYRGTYEHAEMHLVRRYLAQDDRVLEIGAGLGAVGTLCAKMIGSEKVTSVEANPRLQELIRETHKLNGVEPELLIAMVDRVDGEGAFFVEANLHASSSQRRTSTAEQIRVQKVSIATLIARHKPTFLVMDIEGHEVGIFESLAMDGVRKICIELHPHIVGDEACFSVVQALIDHGFVMRFDDIGYRNFYFERRSS